MKKKLKNVITIPYPIDEYQSVNKLNVKCTDKAEKVNIIFASRNDPVKGGELLIHALKHISNSIKNRIVVEFYGFNPDTEQTANFTYSLRNEGTVIFYKLD